MLEGTGVDVPNPRTIVLVEGIMVVKSMELVLLAAEEETVRNVVENGLVLNMLGIAVGLGHSYPLGHIDMVLRREDGSATKYVEVWVTVLVNLVLGKTGKIVVVKLMVWTMVTTRPVSLLAALR
jgi:ATP-dependent protease HslVU (ClpYQ) peptidase subunit